MNRLSVLLAVSGIVALLIVVPLGCAAEPQLQDCTIHDGFHFTITSDIRSAHDIFEDVLLVINDTVGCGAFHISIGDLDESIAENRAVVDSVFGDTTVWYPVVGNHEAESTDDMEWLRTEYSIGHNDRGPLRSFTNEDGPIGSIETTYSWDYGNAHFVILNEYWDGNTALGSDAATDGDIVPELYDWLATDLASNSQPFIFIFGHEPAFPSFRHVGDSLDKYPANRDAFWSLLEAYAVQVFFCGHIHSYYKCQGNVLGIGNTWQLSSGNAGQQPEYDLAYFDVVVGATAARVDVYCGDESGIFKLTDSICLPMVD